MKTDLCFSTLGCTEYTLPEVILLAKNFGIKNIELRGLCGIMANSEIPPFLPENIEDTRKAFFDAGISPVVVGASASFDKAEKHAESIAEAYSAAKVASALGARYIRVFGNKIGKEPEKSINNAICGISALCDKVAPLGTAVLLEVHGDFNKEETLMPVVEALSRKQNFALIWDVAHSDRAYADDWLPFYQKIKPYIRHVHIKDHKRTGDGKPTLTLTEDGDIPLRDIIERLRSDGYSGCFSLEWEKKWHPELPSLEAALERFLRLFE